MKGLPTLLKKIGRLRILVVGDVMLDHYLWGDATRISPEAPVPVAHISRETHTVGGAANVANNVAALGAKVEVVGAIGRDANAKKLCAYLHERHIAFDQRFSNAALKTITKTRVIVRNQQLCRLDQEDPPSAYRQRLGAADLQAIEEKIAKVDGIILSDYAKGMITTALIERITGIARKHGKWVSLDPKPPNVVEFSDLDLVTPNRKEAIELSGLSFGSDEEVDLDRIYTAICAKYRPRNLVITLGAGGMLISQKSGPPKVIPTAARQVYDVSGAGDTVIAALTLAMTAGADLEEAADFANAAAGVVVGKVGTAVVTPEELIAYVSHTP